MTANQILGDTIRLARVYHIEVSLRSLAHALDKSPSWLSKVERGVELPGDETLAAMSDLLDIDRVSMFALAGRIEPDIAKTLAENYREVADELRAICRRYR